MNTTYLGPCNDHLVARIGPYINLKHCFILHTILSDAIQFEKDLSHLGTHLNSLCEINTNSSQMHFGFSDVDLVDRPKAPTKATNLLHV